MDKNKARDILAKALGLESDEKKGVDPEMFLLRLGVAIVSQQKAIEGLVKQYEQTKSEETKQLSDLIEKLRGRTEDLNKLEQLQTKILQAIEEKKVEKIEVERVVERAPETIKLDVKFPNQDQRDNERKSFFSVVKATFANVTEGIAALIQEIQFSRKEVGAIAVRLVDKKGETFYDAMFSAVSGGVSISMASVESLLGQLLSGSNRTYKVASGTASSAGNNTIVAAVTGKLIKVYSYSLFIISTTAVTCIFQDGAGGTAVTRVPLQSPASVTAGAAESVPTPDVLFKTSSNTLLNLNLSAAVTVHYNVRYWDNDAS